MRLPIFLKRRQVQAGVAAAACLVLAAGIGFSIWKHRSGAASIPAVQAPSVVTLLDYSGSPLPAGHVYVTGNAVTYEGDVQPGGFAGLTVPAAAKPASTGYFIAADGREFRTESHMDVTGTVQAWTGWYATATSKHVPGGAINIKLATGTPALSPTFNQIGMQIQAGHEEDIQNLVAYYSGDNGGSFKTVYGVYDGPSSLAGWYRYHFTLDRSTLVAGTSILLKATAQNGTSVATLSQTAIPVGTSL